MENTSGILLFMFFAILGKLSFEATVRHGSNLGEGGVQRSEIGKKTAIDDAPQHSSPHHHRSTDEAPLKGSNSTGRGREVVKRCCCR